MKFRKHLFISYSHIDNEPVSQSDMGWVTRLHNSLEAILSMRLGYQAEIWRDAKLQGNDDFTQEIKSQLPESATLLSVVSPRYIQSNSCLEEAHSFCQAAEATGKLMVDNKCRAFKIIALPVENQDKLPAAMRKTLGFHFYVNDADGVEKQLNPAYNPAFEAKLTNECARLAHSIAAVVEKLDAQPEPGTVAEPAAPAAAAAKPVIYLAECSKDRRDDRGALRMELQMRGYRVLPEIQLPNDEEQYTAEVIRLLAECALSIHLVGSLYGAVCDGDSQKSVVELQNQLSVQHARASRLRRIISLPEGIQATDRRQQAFIDALHRDSDTQFAADVITADLEALKSAVQTALTHIENPPPVEAAIANAPGSPGQLVYLICDERDRKDTIALRKLLKEQGIDVQTPVFEGDAAGVRNANQERLAQCDAVLVFYGAGTEAWKATVDGDLRKATALRPGRPPPLVYTWLAEPRTAAKSDCIEVGEANVIDALQGFGDALLAPFLKALAGARNG